MSSSHVLVASLGSSLYSIVSSANSDSLTSFPVWTPFTSFSSLIVIAWTSKNCVGNSSDSEYPCLVAGVRGHAFTLQHWRDACCGFVVCHVCRARLLSCVLTLYSPTDYSLPGSSVRGDSPGSWPLLCCGMYAPCPLFWRVSFYNKWVLILSKIFSCVFEMIIWVCSNLFIWCIPLIDLWISKNSCIPGIKPS